MTSTAADEQLPGRHEPARADAPVEPAGDLRADHDPDRLGEGQQPGGAAAEYPNAVCSISG